MSGRHLQRLCKSGFFLTCMDVKNVKVNFATYLIDQATKKHRNTATGARQPSYQKHTWFTVGHFGPFSVGITNIKVQPSKPFNAVP